jgi:SAM-dependent methyltransferase
MAMRTFLVLLAVSGTACRPSVPSAAAPASAPAPATPAAAVAARPAHDPAHPPIDCPLRKLGVDPRGLRPFDDVEKYIAYLERPDRAKWQRPDEVVKALGLAGTETVADVGAGSGYFTFRLSRALPRGKVVALDVEPEMIRHVYHKAMTEGFANVTATLSKPDDPGVPPGTDVVFVCDVLHHVKDRAGWLVKLGKEMRSGAKLVLIEFKEGKLPEGPPEHGKIPRAELAKLAAGAGLKLEAERTDLLPYQVFLVFARR